jgi:hypothetical protein
VLAVALHLVAVVARETLMAQLLAVLAVHMAVAVVVVVLVVLLLVGQVAVAVERQLNTSLALRRGTP